MTERGGWYETHAAEAAARYESVAAEEVNGWLLDFLPEPPACVLDVGAGSGRDTAWLASLGHEVIAVDPSPGMLAQARLRHPGLAVRYLHDGLPELTRTLRTGISFDFVLVNAVWMHVPPADRRRAFRKLVTLLKPGGVIAFTLRHPPTPPGGCTRYRARRSRSSPASTGRSSNGAPRGRTSSAAPRSGGSRRRSGYRTTVRARCRSSVTSS